jgi:heterodisulfide reductase subunit A-like polyferredoxin
MANVIARSAFVSQADDDLCGACGVCVERCQFDALALGMTVRVDRARCVGCGLCVPVCPEGALALVRRPAEEVLPPPVTGDDWLAARAAARGLELARVL